MTTKTLEKKIEILEHAFASGTGAYYSLNLTKNLTFGSMYQVVDGREYNVNQMTGIPENASFTDVIEFWGKKVVREEREAYFSFFSLSHLLESYQQGKDHLSHTYHTENVLGDSMFTEQHIIMYTDEESADVLGITYLRDLTRQAEVSMRLGMERQFVEAVCRDYTTVYYVNLKEGRGELLKVALKANAKSMAQNRLRQQISYTETMEAYCDDYVAENNKKEFFRVMQREHLIREMEKTDRFVYRYESIPNQAGHRHFEVQVMRVKEEVFDGNVVVAFRYMDDVVAMEQRYQWELEEIAYSDSITGMGNRAAFTKEMELYEKNLQAACVVADINNLKICNDKYGHQEGDRMILEAAESMRLAFLELGICYRIGGDEFCVLIPKAEEKEILNAIGRMEALIEEKNKKRIMPLSVACGYAIREGKNETVEQLFNRSDAMMYDVKERMKQKFSVYRQEKIKKYLDTLNIIGKTTNAYVYLWDIEADEFWYSEEIDKAYPLHDHGQVFNKSEELQEIVHQADWEMLYQDLQQIAAGKKKSHNMDYRWINRWGEVVWVNCRGTVIPDDKGKPFVMLGRVSDEQLRTLYHPMTKLFNKEKLLLDLKDGLLEKSSGYLMLVGIDKLGDINIKYGRHYGDEVIKRCAEALEEERSLYDIWHVEPNCFAVYLDVETKEEVERSYKRLCSKLKDVCTLSAGVVPNKKQMFKEQHNLYDCAELTLEKAKNSTGKGIVFFSQEDLEEKKKELQLLGEMQESVKNGCQGFYLCYQPQVKSGNYRLYGAEALLRYHSKVRGEVYPDEFIPILEQSGLINQVGIWVLKTALLQCRKWREKMENFHISVNFSAEQLKDSYVAEKVLEVLKETQMPGEALTIELTESSQLQEIPYFDDVFSRWKGIGIELSIDDFGTGYASMAYLKKLSVNEIKIDRMFVKGIEEATYNYRLISNMIDFAKSNGLRVCCEGVETIKELTVLEGLSPEMIQGYLFAKPYKEKEFEQCFLQKETLEHQKYNEFVHSIYESKKKMNVVYFNAKDILRKTEMGLWIIRMKEEKGIYEMHADETMEHVLALERKVTPKECYLHWFDRIHPEYKDYVQTNVKRMIESNKVVQLQYPWEHPTLGEVMVRCSGKRVKDSDGMVTLEGYHRIISNIEET